MSRVNFWRFPILPPKVTDLVEGERRWRCPLPRNPRRKGSTPSPHILHGLSRSTGAYPASKSSCRKPISPGLTSDIVKTSTYLAATRAGQRFLTLRAKAAIEHLLERF